MVKDRNKHTLQRLIKTYVKPNSTIFTDSWKAYTGLEKLGFKHRRINHKRPSKSLTLKRIHTNTIEGNWSGIKMNMLKRDMCKEKLDIHLKEYLWRRKHENNLWEGLLESIKNYKIS